MSDIVFIALAIALFAVSAGYVSACERLTRAHDEALPGGTDEGRS